MTERKLEVGMLLLGGNHGKEGEPLNTVWTVTSVGERSATILAYVGSFHIKANLKTNTLPESWRVVGNKALARLLADLPKDYIVGQEADAA